MSIKFNTPVGTHRCFIGNKEEGFDANKVYASDIEGNAVEATGMALNADSLLRKDEWIKMDEKVEEIKKNPTPLVDWFLRNNLSTQLDDPIASTELTYEVVSEMTDAVVNMDGAVKGNDETVVYETRTMPTPITSKNFTIDGRKLAASRKKGEALDTYQVRDSARVVREKIEEMFLKGDFSAGSGKVQGITNFTYAATSTLATGLWDNTAKTGKQILQDVMSMLDSMKTLKYYDNFTLFIPLDYELKLDEDFSDAKGSNTIRERLLKLSALTEIVTVHTMTADTCVLVQKSKSVCEAVKGFPLQVFQEMSNQGFRFNFRVMEMLLPRFRADYNGNTGILVATVTD